MSDLELETALRRVMASNAEDLAAQRVLGKLQSLPPQKRAFAWWPAALMDCEFRAGLAAPCGACLRGGARHLDRVCRATARASQPISIWCASRRPRTRALFDADSVTGLRP